MYILYETFDDDTKRQRDLVYNTQIINVYNSKELAERDLLKIIDERILDITETEWYYREEKTHHNKNFVKVYEFFKHEIGNYNDFYTIILEKVKKVG